MTYSPAPTKPPSPPTISPAPTIYTIPVLVYLILNPFPQQISWSVLDMQTNQTDYHVPQNTYKYQDQVQEQLHLMPGRNYEFMIHDNGTSMAEYMVLLGTSVNGTQLVVGLGPITTRIHFFELPDRYIDGTQSQALIPVTTVKPTSAPSTASCRSEMAECSTPADCCSLRCVFSLCRPAIEGSRNKLSQNHGGAAQASSHTGAIRGRGRKI